MSTGNLFAWCGRGRKVVQEKCDNLTNRNTSSFGSNLKHHLGRTHRYFIEAGKIISVNNEALTALDPLQLSDDQTEIVIAHFCRRRRKKAHRKR
jgi:hypothetical protein